MNSCSIHHSKVVCTALYVAYCPKQNPPLLHQEDFNDWNHSNVIVGHENGEEHRKCMMAYLIWHKETGSVDSLLLEHHCSAQAYWHKVLTHVVSVIRFLASELPCKASVFRLYMLVD